MSSDNETVREVVGKFAKAPDVIEVRLSCGHLWYYHDNDSDDGAPRIGDIMACQECEEEASVPTSVALRELVDHLSEESRDHAAAGNVHEAWRFARYAAVVHGVTGMLKGRLIIEADFGDDPAAVFDQKHPEPDTETAEGGEAVPPYPRPEKDN